MEQNENARAMPSESMQDEILASILQRLGGSDSSSTNAGAAVEVGASSGGATSVGSNPLGDVFSSLLSNPELIAKLPVIISSVKPIIEMLGKGFSPGAASTSAEASGGAVATPVASSDASVNTSASLS